MKAESIDILKAKVIATYRKHGDKPYLTIMDADGIRKYTGNEVADEIEQETAFGVDCINKLIQLTIDLLSRDKMKYDGAKLSVDVVPLNFYVENIGGKVAKCSIRDKKINTKPFKSGLHINTVKGIMEHPILHIPAYTFEEDDSFVECRRCAVLEEESSIVLTPHQVDVLLYLSQELTWRLGTSKADTKTMNALVEMGLVRVNKYANGDFWQMTDNGIIESDKLKP